MKEIKEIIGNIHCSDTVKFMSEIPENTIDLCVTSPPYNVGINYDSIDDELTMEDYLEWSEKWLSELFRILKDDGRVAINVPFEVNVKERGGRVFFTSEFYQVMKKVGFKFFGLVDLEESSPHRSKTTAWGSWMSPSSPYIYNPKECVILAYKKSPKKLSKGTPQWEGEYQMVPNEKIEGEFRKKLVYDDKDKKEFISLVYGQWNYFADTQQKTKATFSLDIPTKAIKILSYKNDVILDPFAGSGTTLVAAEILGRRWLGVEISENYSKIAKERVQYFIDRNKQMEIEEIKK